MNLLFLHLFCFLLSQTNDFKAWFPFAANSTTTTQKSDYVVEQSSFTLIALFRFEIGRCRGQNGLYGNHAKIVSFHCRKEVRQQLREIAYCPLLKQSVPSLYSCFN